MQRCDMRWDSEVYDSSKSPQTDAGMELVKLACINPADSILDVGCGTGKLTKELASLAYKGRAVGIDPSAEMIEAARKRASSISNMVVFKIPAQELDFDKEFDLVYSNSVFQWIHGQEDAILRSYRALKSKGRIAVQMPAKDFCWEMMENIASAINFLGLEDRYKDMESPWRFPVKEEMARFLRSAGFVNVNVFYKDYMLLFSDINEVLGWGVSAGLRPFLAPLPEEQQERFKYAFAMGFENYRTSRGIEFNFRRLFALAGKE